MKLHRKRLLQLVEARALGGRVSPFWSEADCEFMRKHKLVQGVRLTRLALDALAEAEKPGHACYIRGAGYRDVYDTHTHRWSKVFCPDEIAPLGGEFLCLSNDGRRTFVKTGWTLTDSVTWVDTIDFPCIMFGLISARASTRQEDRAA